MTVPSEFIALANSLADAARPIAARYFRTGVTIDDKNDASPVTIADREAETAMRALLTKHVPEHGVFGEEHGAERTDADYVWVLDPIDGTRAFITGLPVFGTLIALLHRGLPVIGVIDQPILGERWLGVAGRQSTLNGQAIKVRVCPTLDRAYMYSTAPIMFPGALEKKHAALTRRVKLFRWGGDCYAGSPQPPFPSAGLTRCTALGTPRTFRLLDQPTTSSAGASLPGDLAHQVLGHRVHAPSVTA